MSEQEIHITPSQQVPLTPAPWWVRLCRVLWKILAYLGTAVVLGAVASLIATWLTTPQGVILANTPLRQLLASWPIVLPVGCCLLLLALFIRTLSRWTVQVAVPLSPAQQNRARMLRRIRRTYSDVLAQSLQGAVWLELGLAHQPEAVQNAATLLLRLPHRTEQLLPPGTPITVVYEEAAHELLILGEPGAGKSTLLLHLAQQLVVRAEQDDTQPLPVLLPLSSWAVIRPKLQDWLTEQVAQLYDIPEQLARRWVQEEQLLPLLDGLDEMEEMARPACIAAINAFHHAYPGPIVVCSRRAEYEEAAKYHLLSLQSAVLVQPLSHEQADAYLAQAGKSLEALRRALSKNLALRELANTPLMLSVLMLTYQGISVRSLPQKNAELQQQVWNDYVQRMVERKGNAIRYPQKRVLVWLHWLAYEMREHNQTVFYLEHLQPSWLPTGQRPAYIWLAILIPGMLIGVMVSLTIALFLNGYQDLVSLLQFGILGGFLGGFFSALTRGEARFQHIRSRPQFIITVIGVLVGLMYGLSFLDLGYYREPGEWLLVTSINGGVIGLSCWLLMFLLLRFSSRKSQSSATNTARRWHGLRRIMRAWYSQRALLTATVFGGGSALAVWLYSVLEAGLHFGLNYGLINGLSVGLNYGLIFGLTSILVNLILEMQTEGVHLSERLKWTWSSLIRSLLTPKHLRATMLLASIVFALTGLAYGLHAGLQTGLANGLQTGLGNGLFFGLGFGLDYGLCAGLSYWVLLGLFQGISREKVDDQDRRIFNQGIRHSFRTSGIMGLISGGVIGTMGVLSAGLNAGINDAVITYMNYYGQLVRLRIDPGFGLQSGLNYGLHAGLQYGWLLAVIGCLLICTIYGGLGILRHAVLRLLLQHKHTFPWRAAPFLEDSTKRILLRRIGGGYSFTHRLLLDYFADLYTETSSNSPVVQRTRSPS